MKLLIIGGAGFVGSHVVDLLVEREYTVAVLDDLSSCWLDEDTEVPIPKFRNENALYVEDVNSAISFDPEVFIVCSLRHPLERDRELYFAAFDGFLAQTVRIVSSSMRARSKMKRVVVASLSDAFELNPRKKVPAAHLIKALREILTYWHRPPDFETYFAHFPELRGDRRLPGVGDPGEDSISVEEAAEFLVKLAVTKKHAFNYDYHFEYRTTYKL